MGHAPSGGLLLSHPFSWANYPLANGSSYPYKLTKYCYDASYGNEGFTDTLTELENADDAATVNLGPAWRLPTKAECEELANTSRFEWLWQDSSYAMMGGKLVTSNDTGLSLFLPAAGRCHTRLMGRNQTGHYWTTTLGTTPTHANHLSLSNTEQHVRHDYRYEGYTIRPVLSAGVNPILSGFDTEITF